MKDSKGNSRQRMTVKVHPHSSGRWRCTIGKKISVDGSKLVPKDFYFALPQVAALTQARRIAKDWNLITASWNTLYRPTLDAIDCPYAATPHWQPGLGDQPTDAEIAKFQSRPPTDNELGDAYLDVKLAAVFTLFTIDYEREFRDGDISEGTYQTIEKRLRNAQRFYSRNTALREMTHDQWMKGRSGIIDNAKTRKGAKNYLDAIRQALEWFYGSRYSVSHTRPAGFDGYFRIKKVKSAKITIPTVPEVKFLLEGASERIRLVIYLALNMGAYQSDIAALGKESEAFNEQSGTTDWTRKKEPDNALTLSHLLWPETRQLLQRHWTSNGGIGLGKKQIENLFRRHCEKREIKLQFRSLRKATSQILGDLIGGGTDGSLAVAAEVCQEFLGQSGPSLLFRYRMLGPTAYRRMNQYLCRAGDVLRAGGVLK